MKTLEITLVRIYLTESEGRMEGLLKRLHDEEKVRGVTVFRGICGFGQSGKMHASSLLEMHLRKWNRFSNISVQTLSRATSSAGRVHWLSDLQSMR